MAVTDGRASRRNPIPVLNLVMGLVGLLLFVFSMWISKLWADFSLMYWSVGYGVVVTLVLMGLFSAFWIPAWIIFYVNLSDRAILTERDQAILENLRRHA